MKNGEQRALIASTTKIMTGLLVCEAGELDRTVTVPDAAVGLEGSSMYLKKDETLTRRDLLYGMMLHSGNDAALTLAISVSGSEAAFVRQMNLRARALGLTQTHFANPHGLDSGENYSTALDLAHLAQAALQNAQLRAVVSTKTAVCAGRTLTNHNKLLWRYDGCIGVKTGFTDSARRTLVSCAERDGVKLIAVTLNAPDDWSDHTKMLDYGFEKVKMCDFTYDTTELILPVIGSDKETVGVKCDSVKLPLCDEQKEKVTVKIYLPGFVYAGLSAGDKVGEICYELSGKTVAATELTAAESCVRIEQKADIFTVIYKFIAGLLTR